MKPYEILRLLVYNLHLSEVGWLRFLDLKSRRKQEMAQFQNKQTFKNFRKSSALPDVKSKCKQIFAKKAQNAEEVKTTTLVALINVRKV